MPKRISAQENFERAKAHYEAAMELYHQEPADSHEHGAWIVKIKSLIGHADHDLRRITSRIDIDEPVSGVDQLDESLQDLFEKVIIRYRR